MKIFKTAVITIILLFFAILFAGGGHGTYLPAQIIFPYTMILAKVKSEIVFFAILLALIEIPVYSYFIFNKPNWKYYILGIHMLAVLVSFLIVSNNFME